MHPKDQTSTLEQNLLFYKISGAQYDMVPDKVWV